MIRSEIDKYSQKLYKLYLQKKIKDKRFTLISNNCWGSELYHDLNMPYLTPFVGLFLYSPCYLLLLKGLKFYMLQPLKFISHSKYDVANNDREKLENKYPIGLLDDSIEIHFLHYNNEEEALTKWSRRTKRMVWNNLCVKYCDRDLFKTEYLSEFSALNYRKIFFSSRSFPQYDFTYHVKKYDGMPFVKNGSILYRDLKKEFDIADWINGGKGKRILYKVLSTAFM